MTRDELLFSICTINRVYDCCIADDDYDCDKCKRLTKEWFDEYDKQIRTEVINEYYNKINEKLKTDTNLKDTIREIHDNVAREMYCKGIDEFLSEICKMIVQSERNGNYRFYAVEIKQAIADLAEQLKEQK